MVTAPTPPDPDARETAERLGLHTTASPRFRGPDDHLPSLIRAVANLLGRTGRTAVSKREGIGMNEWRTLAELATAPGLRAADLEHRLELDKAAVSRSVGRLVARGLIAALRGSRRSRHLFLTGDGLSAHDDLAVIAVERQRLALTGLDDEERKTLFALLHRVLHNGPALDSHAAAIQPRHPGSIE